ncbi:MAG TPA: hypothetical protein VK899_07860 [Gemmatimonadales bacterium]|nr:hypothetical protein [Gemmatimonadales bacterium]
MTGDINGFLVIGALWFVLTLITRAKGSTRPRRPGPPNYPRPTPLPSRQDPTQQEGVRLQRRLGDLRRALEEAAQASSPSGEPMARSRQAGFESLETSEVRSLEGEGEREPVDLDDEAAGIEARRIQAAAERNAGRKSEAKQPASPVRQEPADHTRTAGYSARQLRDAVVWREILGPPVSTREE